LLKGFVLLRRKRVRIDLGRADDLLEVDQGELGLADAIGGDAGENLDGDEGVAIGGLGFGDKLVERLLQGLRTLEFGDAASASVGIVEGDGDLGIDRRVEGFEGGGRACTSASPTSACRPCRSNTCGHRRWRSARRTWW
jgi:hypothetical protein